MNASVAVSGKFGTELHASLALLIILHCFLSIHLFSKVRAPQLVVAILPQDLKRSQGLLTCTLPWLSVSSAQPGHLGIQPGFFKPYKAFQESLQSTEPGSNPCMACCFPCASISFPSSQKTNVTVPGGVPYSYDKEQCTAFWHGCQDPPEQRWMLRTWQSFTVASRSFQNETGRGAGISAGSIIFKNN